MKNEFEITLRMLKTMKIKPNYSELERKYGVSRQTISKYDKGYKGKPKTRNKKSIFDKYEEEISEKLKIEGVTIKGVYVYFANKYSDFGKESNFRKFVLKKKLKPKKIKKVHPRFETDKGEQLQVDWKEDIQMTSKNGELLEFNILTTTLGYSRLHNFEYSKTRTREDLKRCLVNTFEYMNGVPKEILFDNMSTVVDINKRKVNSEFETFVKDMGSKVKLCKPHSPETKGKDESANRFIAWLLPYNEEFEDENELMEIIANIRDYVNLQKNQTTMIEPILLFNNEKEYLLPLPNKNVIDSYLKNRKKVTVSDDFLVYHKGNRYSVPPKYINQSVVLEQIENKLYIYSNKNIIMMHDIVENENKQIKYNPDHYIEGLKASMKYFTEDEIIKKAEKNLELFENLNQTIIKKNTRDKSGS
jgi:transposase